MMGSYSCQRPAKQHRVIDMANMVNGLTGNEVGIKSMASLWGWKT